MRTVSQVGVASVGTDVIGSSIGDANNRLALFKMSNVPYLLLGLGFVTPSNIIGDLSSRFEPVLKVSWDESSRFVVEKAGADGSWSSFWRIEALPKALHHPQACSLHSPGHLHSRGSPAVCMHTQQHPCAANTMLVLRCVPCMLRWVAGRLNKGGVHAAAHLSYIAPEFPQFFPCPMGSPAARTAEAHPLPASSSPHEPRRR